MPASSPSCCTSAGRIVTSVAGYAVRLIEPVVQIPPRGLGPERPAGPGDRQVVAGAAGRHGCSARRDDPAVPGRLRAGDGRRHPVVVLADPARAGRGAAAAPTPDIPRRGGRELFDVADGPLPDPETPAPPRFLPTYDNIALSHKDRARDLRRSRELDGRRRRLNRMFAGGSLLVDGFILGGWHLSGRAARRRWSSRRSGRCRPPIGRRSSRRASACSTFWPPIGDPRGRFRNAALTAQPMAHSPGTTRSRSSRRRLMLPAEHRQRGRAEREEPAAVGASPSQRAARTRSRWPCPKAGRRRRIRREPGP